MKYLLDTDHISILQRRSGPEFANLWARIVRMPRADLGFSIVSFHEQVLIERNEETRTKACIARTEEASS